MPGRARTLPSRGGQRTAGHGRGHDRVDDVPVQFGGHSPACESQHAGGDDQRSARTGEYFRQGLDGTAIGVGGRLEAPRKGKAVIERKVDHAIRLSGRALKNVEIVGRASADFRSGSGQGGGGSIRAGQPDDRWPAPMSSGTAAEPIQPDAPVTNTRMRNLQGLNAVPASPRVRGSMSAAVITVALDVCNCHQLGSHQDDGNRTLAAGSSRRRWISTWSVASSRRQPRK